MFISCCGVRPTSAHAAEDDIEAKDGVDAADARDTVVDAPDDRGASDDHDGANQQANLTHLDEPREPPPHARAPRGDDYEIQALARTTARYFERALLPGPGGALVTTSLAVPFHQSLSAGARRIDTPLGEDGTDIEVAVYGQLDGGLPDGAPAASWDVASAFVRQRAGDFHFALGRQPVAGGAARYRRMDGLAASVELPFGLTMGAYGGLTALPRWDQWYGYHYLGDAYEAVVDAPLPTALGSDRSQNWMLGARAGWAERGWGSFGLSVHHQVEPAATPTSSGNQTDASPSLEGDTLGIRAGFERIERVDVFADALFSLAQQRFSDVRLGAAWDVFESGATALGLRGEFLHTVPSALLSQASVFSVFSDSEVSEAGGQVDLRLPARLRFGVAGYAQMYVVGDPGLRLRMDARWALDEHETLMLRLQAARVTTSDNGYVMLRAAGRYRFTRALSLSADAYHYIYDAPIEGYGHSNFAALHLGYGNGELWDTRIGGSISDSPYAALDAQVLAQLTISWDRRSL